MAAALVAILMISVTAANSPDGDENPDVLSDSQPFDTIVLHTDTTPIYIAAIRRRASSGKDDVAENDANHEVVELRIAEGTFEQLAYARGEDESACFRRMDGALIYRVYLLGRKYQLNSAQKQRLLLAGRGDLQRLRDRAAELKKRFEKPRVVSHADHPLVHVWVNGLVKAAKAQREYLAGNPALEGELLTKILRRQLTPDQFVEYERSKLKAGAEEP